MAIERRFSHVGPCPHQASRRDTAGLIRNIQTVPDGIDELLKFKGVGRRTITWSSRWATASPGMRDTHVHRLSITGAVCPKIPRRRVRAQAKPRNDTGSTTMTLVTFGQHPAAPFSQPLPVKVLRQGRRNAEPRCFAGHNQRDHRR